MGSCSRLYLYRREPLTTGPWLAQVFDSACIYSQENKTIDLVPLLAPPPAIWAMNSFPVCSCCLPQLFSPEWIKKAGTIVFWWIPTGEYCLGVVMSSSFMEDVSFSTFSSRDGSIWPTIQGTEILTIYETSGREVTLPCVLAHPVNSRSWPDHCTYRSIGVIKIIWSISIRAV